MVAENLKFEKDHEESLIVKKFVLSFTLMYTGLMWYAFVDKSLEKICSIMIAKLVIMAFYKLYKTYRLPLETMPKAFKAHEEKM